MCLVGYILLAILILLILIIFFVPYGVDVIFSGDGLRLGVKAGPLRFWLFPKKPLTPRQQARAEKKKAKREAKKTAKAVKQEQEKKTGKVDAKEKVKPKRKLELDLILALLKMGAHAIRRFFRSFTVDFFQLHVNVASRDPYQTAMEYAYLCSAVEALPALCGNTIRVLRRDIQIGSDFLSEQPEFSGRITVTLQLFRLVHLAVAFGAEFIHWKITRRKEKPAADTERKDENGSEQDQ